MPKTKLTLEKALPWILIIGGLLAYIASFILALDKVKILENPHYVPSCNLNPVLSCGTVMLSHQANVFGFPNPFIGLGVFPVIMVVGGAMLAGAKFKRWFWLGLEAGLVLGIGFAYWLLFESIYRIHALCPYCLVVDVMLITISWYVTLYVIDNKYIESAKRPASKNIQLDPPASYRHPDRLVHRADRLDSEPLLVLLRKHYLNSRTRSRSRPSRQRPSGQYASQPKPEDNLRIGPVAHNFLLRAINKMSVRTIGATMPLPTAE